MAKGSQTAGLRDRGLAIDFPAIASNFSPDSFSPSQLAVTKSNLSVLFFISNGEHYFFCF